jgi:hypothetical protein
LNSFFFFFVRCIKPVREMKLNIRVLAHPAFWNCSVEVPERPEREKYVTLCYVILNFLSPLYLSRFISTARDECQVDSTWFYIRTWLVVVGDLSCHSTDIFEFLILGIEFVFRGRGSAVLRQWCQATFRGTHTLPLFLINYIISYLDSTINLSNYINVFVDFCFCYFLADFGESNETDFP